MSFNLKNLISLTELAIKNKASDIHIKCFETPILRIGGELYPIKSKILQLEDVINLIKILTSEKPVQFSEMYDLDGSFEINTLCRLRFNIFKYLGNKYGVVLRIIQSEIPSFKSLNLPKILKTITQNGRGLNLVTGPTGSGKSTTLAAMVNHINHHKKQHIITIEDPIEFVHVQKESQITQREVGRDVENFNTALRSALRQDPDVILIGEMRDLETVSMCLKAAETGHAVYSTVHTSNVISTIGRLIALFPPEEQEEARKRLAFNLQSVISQRLLPQKEMGMIPALEVMITNVGIQDCILGKDPLSRIHEIIESGHVQNDEGTQTFDQHIFELLKNNLITEDVALNAVSSQANFTQKINFE